VTFFGKPLNEVGQGDLETLVQQEVRERQTVEFKRDAYARNDEGTREMLRDISAMANAYGGDILLGVETVGDGVLLSVSPMVSWRLNASSLPVSATSRNGSVDWLYGLCQFPTEITSSSSECLKACVLLTWSRSKG